MARKHPLDELGDMLPLTWRGIEAPCQQNDISVQQRNVEHKQYGVKASHVENTGRDSARFSFRVMFRSGIQGYGGLYPDKFTKFFDACLDGSVGKMQHPEFGELDCKVDNFKVNYDPNRRDGVDIDVTWIETNEGAYVLEQSYLLSEAVYAAAALADVDVEIPPYDDGSGMSLSESLKAIQGAQLLAQLEVSALLASVSNAINAVNSMIDTLSSLADPKASIAMKYLKDIEASLAAFSKNLPGANKVRNVTDKIAMRAMPINEAAMLNSMSMDDWFALNPMTAATGEVKPGDVFFVYEA